MSRILAKQGSSLFFCHLQLLPAGYLWGPGPNARCGRCITSFCAQWAHAPPASPHAYVGKARVNSSKSSTYSVNVETQIIGAKVAATAVEVKAGSAAPAVQHLRVDAESAGQRLDNFLLRLLKGVPKTHVYRVIRSGEVRLNKGRASADSRVAEGDDVRVPPMRLPEPSAAPIAPAREFPVLLEDEHLLAIAKPAGVAVHGGSGVSSGVIEQLRSSRLNQPGGPRFLELVHRLDKETSGVLLLAKKRSALTAMQDQFRSRLGEKAIFKSYSALVFGDWPEKLKVIDQALHKGLDAKGERHVRVVAADHADGRRSITLVKVVQRLTLGGQGLSLLDVTLKTGRTHQIRVHLAAQGHPIVGDPKYGDFPRNKTFARAQRFERMFLHARQLAFDHPASGERITLTAPLPADCTRLLNS